MRNSFDEAHLQTLADSYEWFNPYTEDQDNDENDDREFNASIGDLRSILLTDSMREKVVDMQAVDLAKLQIYLTNIYKVLREMKN
jgi:hypothetical protein